ncbi:uncharacterized protein METZ01_LOCUS482143, partial [marine metagenome]
EPVKETYKKLLKNIDLNQISNKVTTSNIAIGEDEDIVCISNTKGALNRVVKNKKQTTEVVIQKTLDVLSIKEKPSLLKIDVEGYEVHVLKGGKNTLTCPELQGLIIELNGNSKKYGATDAQIHKTLISYGFNPICYNPFNRNVKELNNYNIHKQNTIYIKDIKGVQEIIKKSQKYQVGKYRL